MGKRTQVLLVEQTQDGMGPLVVVDAGIHMIAASGEFDRAVFRLFIEINKNVPLAPVDGVVFKDRGTINVSLPDCSMCAELTGSKANTKVSACISRLAQQM